MILLLLLVAVTTVYGQNAWNNLSMEPIKLPGEGDWIVAFRVQAGLGQAAYPYFNDVGHHDDTLAARSTMLCGCYSVDGVCNRHYRSSILDNWALVQQVKISLFIAGVEEASVTFDATGTNYNDWMDKNRVISSTWTGFLTQPVNYFSIQGDTTLERHFFINSVYPGCANDAGWLVLKDEEDACDWGKRFAYPAILFADRRERVNYNSEDVGDADVMIISVKLVSSCGAQCSA